MMGLNHNSKLPRFTVSSEDLGRVSNMADSLNLRDGECVAKHDTPWWAFRGPRCRGRRFKGVEELLLFLFLYCW